MRRLYEVAPSCTTASTTCWRSSPLLRHPPVSFGPLAHPKISSLLQGPVTRRSPLLQGLRRCRHLHLRSHPSGRAGVLAKTWSQIQQVSCTYRTHSADPPSPTPPSQPSRTRFRRGSSSCTPYTVGSGRPGKTWRSVSEIFRCGALSSPLTVDPRWANPIKNMIRQNNQARAVNEVVNALEPSTMSRPEVAQLRVINGISTNTSSTITTAARENVCLTPVDGFSGQPGNSTIRWAGGLHPHLEHDQEHDPTLGEREMPQVIAPPPPRPIDPSLATLEKAVSARIYFENLYFPLLRHPPSREQRKLAMEREMAELQLSEHQKENLRTRWRQNETDYLRHQRCKVDATAFAKLKTIGHGSWFGNVVSCIPSLTSLSGAFGVVSLVREKSSGGLFAMKEVLFPVRNALRSSPV